MNLVMERIGKKVNWSWSSAVVGAASAVAATALMSAKPKDPTFHVISIEINSLKLNFPSVDAELILTVHVTNPNIVAIQYSSTTLSIYYDGSLFGTAEVKAGSQPAKSCQLLRLPATIDGVELAHHARRFFADVARREMVLEARVDIQGSAKVMWWANSFKVHVDTSITVDPIFLDIIHQDNKSHMDLFIS